MNYQKFPFVTIQIALDRIALLEWFIRNEEATDEDVGELIRLKRLIAS